LDQGASPGTPVVRSRKTLYPVVLKANAGVCLSIIGQGATFCLWDSCSVGSHKDGLCLFSLRVWSLWSRRMRQFPSANLRLP
jgi:hypothetical protein